MKKETRPRESTNMQKQIKLKVPNKRVKRRTMQKFQTLVFKEDHRQRKQTKEKENPCDRNEKNKKWKKKQMKKWMNKRVT